jgi:hypothetical protein
MTVLVLATVAHQEVLVARVFLCSVVASDVDASHIFGCILRVGIPLAILSIETRSCRITQVYLWNERSIGVVEQHASTGTQSRAKTEAKHVDSVKKPDLMQLLDQQLLVQIIMIDEIGAIVLSGVDRVIHDNDTTAEVLEGVSNDMWNPRRFVEAPTPAVHDEIDLGGVGTALRLEGGAEGRVPGLLGAD